MNSGPRYTTTDAADFAPGLLRHRVEVGALVAEGLAPAGSCPQTWTVTRRRRGACRGWTGRATLAGLRDGEVGGRSALDARMLGAVIAAAGRGRMG